MAKQAWKPGAVISKSLDDGLTYYGHLLESPWVAFYDFRTEEPIDDLEQIVEHPPLFTVAAVRRLIAPDEWKIIGTQLPGESLRPPREQFMQSVFNPSNIQIIDDKGNTRPATPDEAEGLESAAVWDTVHIEDRLKDHYAGRPNKWLESMRLKR